LSFLLWDGETINGERYDPEAHQINIRVTHYASRVEGQLPAADVDPVVNELVVRLGDMETVSDLKTRIATLTGIPVDKQYLCRIEYQYVSCCIACAVVRVVLRVTRVALRVRWCVGACRVMPRVRRG